MKRLIIIVCIILIGSAGIVLSGCQGGQIEGGASVDTTASLDDELAVGDTSGGVALAAPVGQCDPVVITNTVIEVVGGDENLAAEPEGQTCLMSRVPGDASFVFSVLKNTQSVVAAVQNVIPDSMAEKREVIDKFMMPFDELGLEEVVGFGKFKYVYGIVDKPDGACRECVKIACPSCLGEAEELCDSYSPPPDDIGECAWDKASPDNPIADCANNCIGQCAEKCTEEKPEMDSYGVLVRWLLRDEDADGARKLADLDAFLLEMNNDSLLRAQKKWDESCSDPNNPCDPSYIRPNSLVDLKDDQVMEIKPVDATTALLYSRNREPALVEPVRICNFVRFDAIQTRPPVYAELNELKLFMKIKPGEALTAATRDSRKLVAGIDLRDNYYRLYAGVVDRQTLATGAYLSSVINLGDNFGMEAWAQVITGLITKK